MYEDLTGQKFHRLTVVSHHSTVRKYEQRWECNCDCGNLTVVNGAKLKSGRTKSCGCYKKEKAKNTFKDLTGLKFGRLTVLRKVKDTSPVKWVCKCDCGNITEPSSTNLMQGASNSCGCGVTASRYKHGLTKSKPYVIWWNIIQRCYNEKHTSYHRYGGRGIKVCDEWRSNFLNFYDWFVLNYKRGLQIDRIDNDKGYSPDNCRLVNRSVNLANRNKLKVNTSGYIGVGKNSEKFFTSVRFHSEIVFQQFGFQTAEEAARARDEFITANNLPHKLNFPHPAQEIK